MNIVLLTHEDPHMHGLQNYVQQEHCKCCMATDLCMLEKEARTKKLLLVLVANNFLHENESISIITECLGPLNEKTSIAFFDSESFNPDLLSSTIDNEKKSEILRILNNIQNNINTFELNYNTKFRPAERKLYDLLKNNEDIPLSLDEMSLFLWGNTSSAHNKTLYSYIHRIKYLLAESNKIEWIIKEKKGYYKISSDIQSVHPIISL